MFATTYLIRHTCEMQVVWLGVLIPLMEYRVCNKRDIYFIVFFENFTFYQFSWDIPNWRPSSFVHIFNIIIILFFWSLLTYEEQKQIIHNEKLIHRKITISMKIALKRKKIKIKLEIFQKIDLKRFWKSRVLFFIFSMRFFEFWFFWEKIFEIEPNFTKTQKYSNVTITKWPSR